MNKTKEILLKTAYNMFLYNNYEAVTINSILKATGLTKGGIYYHFVSKEEIFKAVVDKYMIENRTDKSIVYKTLKELIQNSIDKAKTRMTKHIVDNKSFQNGMPINYLSMVVAAYRYYPGYEKIGSEFIENQVEIWERVIKSAIEKGEIRDDIDIEATAANFLQISSGIVSTMMRGGTVINALDMYTRQNWELYKGIKK